MLESCATAPLLSSVPDVLRAAVLGTRQAFRQRRAHLHLGLRIIEVGVIMNSYSDLTADLMPHDGVTEAE